MTNLPLNLPTVAELEAVHKRLIESALTCDLTDHRAVARVVLQLVDAGLTEPARGLVDPLEQLRDPKTVQRLDGELLFAVARLLWRSRRREEMLDLIEAVTERAIQEGEAPLRRALVLGGWHDALNNAPNAERDRVLQRFEEEVHLNGGPALLLADLMYLRSYRELMFEGRVKKAHEAAALASSIFAHHQERDAAARSTGLLCRVLLIEGNVQTCAVEARRLLEYSRLCGNIESVTMALVTVATTELCTGNFTLAREASLAGLDLCTKFSEFFSQRALALNIARVDLFRGNLTAARSMIEEIESWPKDDWYGLDPLVLEYEGMLHLAEGDPEAALHRFDRCLENIRSLGISSYEVPEARLRRAQALIALERFPEAHAECSTGLSELQAMGSELEVGHLRRSRARAALSMGRPLEAAEDLDAAEKALRRVGDEFELAQALLDRARLQDAQLEARLADAMESLDLFRRMGIAHYEKSAAELVSELRATLRSRHAEDGQAALAVVRSGKVIARSPSMIELLRDALTAAHTDAPVLIQGETGTGKEVIARFVHQHSPRGEKPFVPVNCAAIPESLFEREFFGHSKGAFTGADRDGLGLVEAANGGTLFLDEVGEMPLPLQPKLLRLLQEGTYRRVGEAKERKADLRVLAASNRILFERAQAGEFREDLFYRLSWFELELPPLRERPEDLRALAEYFVARQSECLGRQFWIESETWEALMAYHWPGNVRQLESAVSAACIRADGGGSIRPEYLPAQVRRRRILQRRDDDLNLASSLRRHEREVILRALQRTGYRRTPAASLLGIARNTLYEKMKRLGIEAQAAD